MGTSNIRTIFQNFLWTQENLELIKNTNQDLRHLASHDVNIREISDDVKRLPLSWMEWW